MLGFIAGVFVCIVALALFGWFNRSKGLKDEEAKSVMANLKESFGALSMEALSKNTTEFLKIANETLSKQMNLGEKDLEGKKKFIDQTLDAMKQELQNVQRIVSDFEKDREMKFGELSNQLKVTAQQTGELRDVTTQLRSALTGTASRGQWGGRIAEDILRLAGFIEGINYLKEKAQSTVNTRPDYTFLLPQGLKVNMDVKFPLNGYLRYLEVENDTERQRFRDQFLRDARTRIKEVTSRDYINPEEKTLDYVIVFIPNEQAYAFINENDRSLLDDALRSKVIVCSPLTLYAILAVIRQAVDNFNLEKTASQILSLLGAFNKQWDAFITSFDKLGDKIKAVQDEYDTLTSTRRTKLDRPIRKIEDLRRQKGIPEANVIEGELDQLEALEESR
ncbi:MAG: DNA recombination protein RmuC [Candidatus Omnitrophica bacterium]|nr:DNA recombination protein RmuC [Candidatus Omnitrophota bacterium]